ncbi:MULTISPECIES: hypothetical protein [unclassified Xanthomonas]|uniref:hypothetical protein n=1 Tax=unclassified Xanthomonas TaxID=2643310 RepID=UPI001621CF2C|nr:MULTISPECIES: hypothetical protein [unclassified Xanthomonas]MBB4130029.1 hypothetical protein [Xanthomonas sp. 3075]MBB5865220.1 hypothetical protein [Xanthomonas sp. 3058]
MLAHAQVLRRVQRLLPAGIDTVALLPAALPHGWERSPLSALPIRHDWRRGVIGLRLQAETAQALRMGDAGCLQAAQQSEAALAGTPRTRSYGPWQRLSNGTYWARSTDALLGVLLACADAEVWLLWQQPAAVDRRKDGWLR